MIDYLVILTMQRAMDKRTIKCVLPAGAGTTRDDLFDQALTQLVERERYGGLAQGQVLFFSAEPLQMEDAR